MSSTTASSPKQLLALSVLGAGLLFGAGYFNGTLGALYDIQKTAVFPDGRALRTVYTGFSSIDYRLRPLVALLDVLSNEKAGASKWLAFNLSIMCRTIIVWGLIESRRRGVRNTWLRHFILFAFFENWFGAAVMAPFYMWTMAESKATSRDRTIPLNEARAFVPFTLTTAAMAFLVYAPTWLGLTTDQHQRWLGLYELSPIYLCIAIVLFSRPGTSMSVSETPKDAKNPNVDKKFVVAGYTIAAILSSVAYLATVITIACGLAGEDLTFTRLFKPSPSLVSAAAPGSYEALREGVHLFTQYQHIIVGAACVIYTNHMMTNIPKEDGTIAEVDSLKAQMDTVLLGLGAVVIGPAGTGSIALAVRELKMRRQLEVEKAE